MIEGRLCVAIVDDEESVRRSVGRLLRSAGMEAATFGSGEELLAAATRGRFDCLVLDLHMPAMNGFELHAELARRGLRIPAVVVTGHDKPEHRAQASQAGVSAYLLKPVDESVLIGAIMAAVPGASGRKGG